MRLSLLVALLFGDTITTLGILHLIIITILITTLIVGDGDIAVLTGIDGIVGITDILTGGTGIITEVFIAISLLIVGLEEDVAKAVFLDHHLEIPMGKV